jgi:hypothetical protein
MSNVRSDPACLDPACLKEYQLCDYGILNIAIAYRDFASFQTLYERCMSAGFTADSEPMQLPRR